jgi:simple sugar transport system permease protein
VIFAVIAGVLGVSSISRGAKRVGWGAVAAGLAGVLLASLATQSGEGNLNQVFTASLIASMLVFATPLTFGAIGGMFSERSGVVNIGLEGMMLMGAFFSVLVADKAESWVLGLGAGMLAGGATALVHAFFSIHLRADQIVTGTAINFLALGLTGYLYVDVYGQQGTPTDIPSIPSVHLGFLEDVYFVGDVLSNMNLMIWGAILLVVVSWASTPVPRTRSGSTSTPSATAP